MFCWHLLTLTPLLKGDKCLVAIPSGYDFHLCCQKNHRKDRCNSPCEHRCHSSDPHRESGKPEHAELPTATAQSPNHTTCPPTQPVSSQCWHTWLSGSQAPNSLSTLPASVRCLLLASCCVYKHELAQLLHMSKMMPSLSHHVTKCWY